MHCPICSNAMQNVANHISAGECFFWCHRCGTLKTVRSKDVTLKDAATGEFLEEYQIPQLVQHSRMAKVLSTPISIEGLPTSYSVPRGCWFYICESIGRNCSSESLKVQKKSIETMVDAMVWQVLKNEDGSGSLKLIGRHGAISEIAGWTQLFFLRSPEGINKLLGAHIREVENCVLLGEEKIADRLVNQITFVNQEEFSAAVRLYA